MDYIKVEVYIPQEFEDKLIDEINSGGYIQDGFYDRVYCSVDVTGHWRTNEGANPYDGSIGEISSSPERKIEFRIKKKDLQNVDKIIKSVHPYEVPVINYISLIEV